MLLLGYQALCAQGCHLETQLNTVMKKVHLVWHMQHLVEQHGLLPSMIASMHLQQAHPCLAHRRTQSWPTQDSLKSLANATHTMTIADLLPKTVLQTYSFTGTKDSNNVFAPTMPMQQLSLQPHKGTEALQPHCPEQSAAEINSPNGKHF